MNYAIIDIETTGLSPGYERITEVAILIHDGKKVTDRFITLVNPEKRIPYRITELTGINNSMVARAPRFCEVARNILEITEGCIFVAHNATFDYSFIRAEYARLGYNYQRQTLCTKRLSQKILPGRRSYSLGNLCSDLKITVNNRHRAFGDAEATVKLFEHLLAFESAPESLSLRGIRTNIPPEKLRSLPETAGVYYFHDEDGRIIYVGKSINIRERVLSHFTSNASGRESEMRDQTYDVSFELCGSELISLLLESEEVKNHSPRFNRLLRRKSLQWGLYSHENENGYICLSIKKNDGSSVPLTTFPTKKSGAELLFTLVHLNRLCQKLCGLYKVRGACFQYQIRQCNGACAGEEPPEEYNSRVLQAIEPFLFIHESFVLLDKGRNCDEKAVVLVENHRYCGYGFVPVNEAVLDPHHLKNYINIKPDHRDAHQIIRSYMKHDKAERVIRIS